MFFINCVKNFLVILSLLIGCCLINKWEEEGFVFSPLFNLGLNSHFLFKGDWGGGGIDTCPPLNSNLKALKTCLSLSCYSIYSIDRFVERRAACSVNCYRICHHLYCITKDLRDADFIFLTLFRQWMMFWGSCIKGSFNSLNSLLIWRAVGSQWEKRNTVMQSQHYLPAAWILNLFPINIWLT